MTEETRVVEMELSGQIDHTRHRDWYDPTVRKDSVTLVGTGGVGSLVAVCLTKLGIPYLTFVDPDEVETHNIPNQFFQLDDMGKPKVDALYEHCQKLGSSDITPIQSRIQEAIHTLRGVVVMSPDSMDVRKDVWEQVKYKPHIDRLVDGRIGGQYFVVHFINPSDPEDIAYYEDKEILFDDETGEEAPCTAAGVSDVGFAIAAIITRQLRTYFAEKEVPRTVVVNMETLDLVKS